MDVIDPAEIMKGFRRVYCSAAGSVELRGVLDNIRCVRARLDRVEAEVARRLETITGTPERDVAKARTARTDTARKSSLPLQRWPTHRNCPTRLTPETSVVTRGCVRQSLGHTRRSSESAVIVRDGAVIDADGELNLGRTTRLGNRAQRRAVRAVYATCAVPGCAVAFDHTTPHHLHWWRHGGPTDFANLLLCSKPPLRP